MYSRQFSKIFISPKMAPILNSLNFCQKWKNSTSLTVRDRAISSNFRPTGYLRNVLLAIFKYYPLPKNSDYFEFLSKMEKHKFNSISLTVRDRAISSKFSTHRVSKQGTLGNFQKIFISPKVAAILNFCQKMEKQKFPSISLTVQDRAISQSTLANFVQVLEQNSCFPLGGHYACQCVLFLVIFCSCRSHLVALAMSSSTITWLVWRTAATVFSMLSDPVSGSGCLDR